MQNAIEIDSDVGTLRLRLIRRKDGPQWRAIRLKNQSWLGNWDPTTPPKAPGPPPTFAAMVRTMKSEARAGRIIPWVIELDGSIIGQLTIGGIMAGSLRSAHAGYWIDEDFAGHGLMPLALAAGIDYCFGEVGLHRVEVNLRPENVASRRVVEKLGLRYEGYRQRYLHIDGDWRDHLAYAITAEEVPRGLANRYRSTRNQKENSTHARQTSV